jgi:hypothetical protein
LDLDEDLDINPNQSSLGFKKMEWEYEFIPIDRAFSGLVSKIENHASR